MASQDKSRVHHRGEQGDRPGDGPRARTSWESPSSSAAGTRQTAAPPPKSFAPKGSRRSSPSGSTSPGRRIIKQIARHLEKRYGKLDILVNNAGVMLDEAEFEEKAGPTRRPR